MIADDLVDASNQRNIPISSDIAAALVGQADNTGLLVKGVAMKSHDPVQQEKINTAAQEIPHATKNVLLASKRVLDHPDDPQAKAGLRDAQKEVPTLAHHLLGHISDFCFSYVILLIIWFLLFKTMLLFLKKRNNLTLDYQHFNIWYQN